MLAVVREYLHELRSRTKTLDWIFCVFSQANRPSKSHTKTVGWNVIRCVKYNIHIHMVLILYQRKNAVRSVRSWQISPNLFSVWSTTRVSPRTDPFPPIHGGPHTVDWTPCTSATPVCWRHPDPGVLQPFACQFLWRSVKEFWCGEGSNFGLFHWLASSPLKHSRTTVRVCDTMSRRPRQGT